MVTVKELAGKLNLKVVTGEGGLHKEVQGAYICDLLSWVMSRAQKGNVWITVQTNVNVAAVALLTEVSCVIVPENIKIDEQTIVKANNENIPLLSSSSKAYELAVMIHEQFTINHEKNDG